MDAYGYIQMHEGYIWTRISRQVCIANSKSGRVAAEWRQCVAWGPLPGLADKYQIPLGSLPDAFQLHAWEHEWMHA